MIRAIALVSAAGLAASALAQTAPPTLSFLVRNTDAIPGVSDANAIWNNTGTNGAFNAPALDQWGNVMFRGRMLNTTTVPNPNGGTALVTNEGIWYGGQWNGTGGTGTLSLVSRFGYGLLPTGSTRYDATTNLANGLGNNPPSASGPWGLAGSYNFNNFPMSPNGNMLIGYNSMNAPTNAQVNAGTLTNVNGIISGGSVVVGGVTTLRTSNDAAMFIGTKALPSSGPAATTLTIAGQRADQMPNTAGAILSLAPAGTTNSMRVDNQGRVVLNWSFRENWGDSLPNAAAVSNRAALYYGSPGNMQMIYRVGTNNASAWNQTGPVTNAQGTFNITQVDYSWLPVAGATLSGAGDASANGAGELVFGTTMSTDAALGVGPANADLLAHRTASGAISVVGREGAPTGVIPNVSYASDAGGFTPIFTTSTNGVLNNSGRYIYSAALANTGASGPITTGVNSTAIFTGKVGSTPRLFHQAGEDAPSLGGDPFNPILLSVTNSANSVRLNNANQALWVADLTGAGVNTAAGQPNSSSALYLTQMAADGAISSDMLLARRGDLMPSGYGAAGLRWGGFFNTILNGAGQFVFSTTPQNGVGSTTGQQSILLAWDPQTGFQKIVQVGEVINGITVSSFSLDTGTTAEGTANAFSDTGILTFSITGVAVGGVRQSAIVTTRIIPAPGTAALLGVAGIAAARRRRR
ncbi:MAG: hypothetical protein K2Q20_10875 [Phycisphaerales bacterium]|nr:hypothetical protein [Phycisphaerales bacterium]